MSQQYKNIVILTGAGISAESGIQTFRASDGLWHDHSIEEVATPEGFAANPELVQSFYNDRRRQLTEKNVQPNVAHYALAKLEKHWQGQLLLVTQNVDNLHERAGSQSLIHMHGELHKVRCTHSELVYPWESDVLTDQKCECCQRSGTLRPHIVWFGEMPFSMVEIAQALQECDLFLSIGTSGQVYPAAGFVDIANEVGAKSIEINLDPTDASPVFDVSIQGKAGEVLPDFVDELLDSWQ